MFTKLDGLAYIFARLLYKGQYLQELSRQHQTKGTTAVATVEADVDIAVRLYLAGHSKAAVKRAVMSESLIATALPSEQHQLAYVEKVIEPTLRAPKVRAMRQSINSDKQQRDQHNELRLDQLNLATQILPRDYDHGQELLPGL